jgi:3-hydroxyacyl-[acyl-carrier-protein] dehydratase
MNKLVYFMTIDSARFRKPVVPGDLLRIHVTRKQNRGAVWKFDGEAKVGDKLVAEATFAAMIVDS